MKAILKTSFERAEQRDIDVMEQDFERIQNDVAYFQGVLAQKKSEYDSGILNRSVDASANLRKDLEAIGDIIKENQRLAQEKRQSIDVVLAEKARVHAMEAASAQVFAVESEKAEVEAEMTRLRQLQAEIPPQLSRLEWQWNQLLWRLDTAKSAVNNLELQEKQFGMCEFLRLSCEHQ